MLTELSKKRLVLERKRKAEQVIKQEAKTPKKGKKAKSVAVEEVTDNE